MSDPTGRSLIGQGRRRGYQGDVCEMVCTCGASGSEVNLAGFVQRVGSRIKELETINPEAEQDHQRSEVDGVREEHKMQTFS